MVGLDEDLFEEFGEEEDASCWGCHFWNPFIGLVWEGEVGMMWSAW